MDETIIRQKLASLGFEFLRAASTHPDGSVEVEANKLYHVGAIKNAVAYVPIAVALTVKDAGNGQVTITAGGTPTVDEVEATESFVKSLIDNNQLAGLPGPAAKNATHALQPNESGLNVIRRHRVFGR